MVNFCIFILAYNNYARGIHGDIYICAYNLSQLDSFLPSFFLVPAPILLRSTSTDFTSLFSYMYTKCLQHIPPPLSSLATLPLPMIPTPGQNLFYLPVHHILSTLDSRHILCFNQIKHALLTLFLSPFSFIIQKFTVLSVILSSYTDVLHSILFSSPASHNSIREKDKYNHVLYHSII